MLVVSKGDSSYEMKITVLTITSSGFKLNETNVRLHITYDQFFFSGTACNYVYNIFQ